MTPRASVRNPESSTVLIMAGGTGGHIFPGLAVAESLRGNGVHVAWLGASGGMECARVPAAGIELHTVSIGGIRGKGWLTWLKGPVRLIAAVVSAFRIIGGIGPDCAVSFGGYAAGPGGLAAWLRGVPLLVHEQNRVAGLTNRVLSRLASRVMQAFPGTWPESLSPVTCGNPVRREVASLRRPQERFEGRNGPLRLLVTGGSQGARALNVTVPNAVALLASPDRPSIRHQAGAGAAGDTSAAYEAAGVAAEVVEFIDDMASAYAWADLVICRAGALTVSELAAAGVGAILVPFPHAVDDHQARNADFLRDLGGAMVVREADLTPGGLASVLSDLSNDREALQRMASASRSGAVPDAADCVAHQCAGIGRFELGREAA